MRFTENENILERDKHLIKQWLSASGFISINIESIIGAVRVQVWYDRPDAGYPDILRCTWDTPPDQRVFNIVEDIQEALGELPELADQRSVQQRLQILMFEKYGDIYDGLKCRVIDRDHKDYNPHANPWWANAVELREQLNTGVYRHHLPLNLEAPNVGEVWAEPEQPETVTVEPPLWTVAPENYCLTCEFTSSTAGSGASPPMEGCPVCHGPLTTNPEGIVDEEPQKETQWLEQAWVNDKANDDPERPNPGWVGPPKPYSE
jgi:hypothetical protein